MYTIYALLILVNDYTYYILTIKYQCSLIKIGLNVMVKKKHLLGFLS